MRPQIHLTSAACRPTFSNRRSIMRYASVCRCLLFLITGILFATGPLLAGIGGGSHFTPYKGSADDVAVRMEVDGTLFVLESVMGKYIALAVTIENRSDQDVPLSPDDTLT